MCPDLPTRSRKVPAGVKLGGSYACGRRAAGVAASEQGSDEAWVGCWSLMFVLNSRLLVKDSPIVQTTQPEFKLRDVQDVTKLTTRMKVFRSRRAQALETPAHPLPV